jgi:hypothetical protein
MKPTPIEHELCAAERRIRNSVIAYARDTTWGRRRRGLVAIRVTGDSGLGGCWQCYVASSGGQTSHGPQLHATSAGVVTEQES